MDIDNVSATVIERKPIVTAFIRRNARYNPEFLDPEVLLLRFEPLIKSIHRRFCSFCGSMYSTQEFREDLYSQILLEFVKLVKIFDPKRGVDIVGFIKMNLQQRIYQYVMKQQKNDILIYNDDDQLLEYESFAMSEATEIDDDEDTESSRCEALAIIPWDKFNKEEERLIKYVLVDRMSIEDIALKERITERSVKQRLNKLCELIKSLRPIFSKIK